MSAAAKDLPARPSTLHILNKAPAHPRVAPCFSALAASDVLLLTENGVLGALEYASAAPCPVLLLDADARARGLITTDGAVGSDIAAPLMNGISYAQMVQLSASATRIISW